MNAVLRIRGQTNRAVEHELESWQNDRQDAVLADQVESVLQLLLRERDGDRDFLRQAVRHMAGRPREILNEMYQTVRETCSAAMRVLERVKEQANRLAEHGYKIRGADQLDQAINDYAEWKEDFHDAMLLCDRDTQAALKKRLANGRPTKAKKRSSSTSRRT